jgi:Lrp/AsnC family leucine-responsive transcriptional regulator
MDGVDYKILYQLDLNSRTPAKKIATLTGLKPDVVDARLKKLIKNKVITRFYPEIDRSKLGYYPFKVYLQLQGATPEKVDEIYSYLASLPSIGWVVLCTGRWDMIFAVWANNVAQFNQLYEEFLSKYNKYVLSKVFSVTVELYLSNKKWLDPDAPKSQVVRVSGVPNRIISDEDSKILHYLGSNGRASIMDIAKKTGIEPEEVDKQIKAMQKTGTILSFRIDLDLAQFGRMYCKSFVYTTKSSKEEEERLLEYCFRHPEVSGEIEAQCKSFEDFNEMMDDIRNRYPDIVRNFEGIAIDRESGVTFAPKEKGMPKESIQAKTFMSWL